MISVRQSLSARSWWVRGMGSGHVDIFLLPRYLRAHLSGAVSVYGHLGIRRIDFHCSLDFRHGDCRPNPQLYPNGHASVRAMIDKLHAAGIAAGLHTYSFLMDKSCPWVTPVPDPRLGKDATFTLATAVSDVEADVPVREDTSGMSTTVGFIVRNSVTIQIDDDMEYLCARCAAHGCGMALQALTPGPLAPRHAPLGGGTRGVRRPC